MKIYVDVLKVLDTTLENLESEIEDILIKSEQGIKNAKKSLGTITGSCKWK